ncbi:hypothetical protein EV426DRAFT_707442 [Tirmania nivea]|nr:hypothetical protein EV426DRAFT_707442 [Tirmania nivea]
MSNADSQDVTELLQPPAELGTFPDNRDVPNELLVLFGDAMDLHSVAKYIADIIMEEASHRIAQEDGIPKNKLHFDAEECRTQISMHQEITPSLALPTFSTRDQGEGYKGRVRRQVPTGEEDPIGATVGLYLCIGGRECEAVLRRAFGYTSTLALDTQEIVVPGLPGIQGEKAVDRARVICQDSGLLLVARTPKWLTGGRGDTYEGYTVLIRE